MNGDLPGLSKRWPGTIGVVPVEDLALAGWRPQDGCRGRLVAAWPDVLRPSVERSRLPIASSDSDGDDSETWTRLHGALLGKRLEDELRLGLGQVALKRRAACAVPRPPHGGPRRASPGWPGSSGSAASVAAVRCFAGMRTPAWKRSMRSCRRRASLARAAVFARRRRGGLGQLWPRPCRRAPAWPPSRGPAARRAPPSAGC